MFQGFGCSVMNLALSYHDGAHHGQYGFKYNSKIPKDQKIAREDYNNQAAQEKPK